MENTADFLGILPITQVLNTIPSGLFLVDRQQRIVYWNNEAERITGYSAAEAIGRHCSFLEGIECGAGCGLYNTAIRKPIIGAFCTNTTKAGKQIHLSKNVDYLMHNGEIVGGIESFVDLTKQITLQKKLHDHARELEETVRQRTAELETERRRLSNLLDSMDDFAYITSPDCKIEFANRALVETFGEVTGKTCFSTFYQLDEPCPSCPMQEVLAGATVSEERRNLVNGRIYEIVHTPLVGNDTTARKLAVCRDITERKQTEEALRRANQELDAFVHTVSHDLRTPLTPIIGFAEFLQDNYAERLDARGLDIVGEIITQARKMLHFMEDLLALARVGRLPEMETPLPLAKVVSEVIEELDEQIREHQASIQVGALPDAKIPPTLLQQLFGNLLGNALRYGCQSGCHIEVSGERQGQLLRLLVRDFGPGIPEEDKERIFDLFYRAGGAQETVGTGIGLAIVKKIALLYQGSVRVEESPGGGCTFIVELIEPS